jgi:hypothetical protein
VQVTDISLDSDTILKWIDFAKVFDEYFRQQEQKTVGETERDQNVSMQFFKSKINILISFILGSSIRGPKTSLG